MGTVVGTHSQTPFLTKILTALKNWTWTSHHMGIARLTGFTFRRHFHKYFSRTKLNVDYYYRLKHGLSKWYMYCPASSSSRTGYRKFMRCVVGTNFQTHFSTTILAAQKKLNLTTSLSSRLCPVYSDRTWILRINWSWWQKWNVIMIVTMLCEQCPNKF